MTNINQRLKMIRESFNVSQARFSKDLGLPQSTYAQYELNSKNVPDDLKIRLSQMGVNMNWLISGVGPMYLVDMSHEEKIDYINSTLPIKKETFITPKGKRCDVVISEDGSTISIPVLAQKISAGKGINWMDSDEYSGERVAVLSRFVRMYPQERLGAAEVRGDSMSGIMLFDGDIVIFARGTMDGDGVYVLSLGGEIMVKRLTYNPLTRTVKIISENKKYEPFEASVDNENLTIIGKVIGWLHHHPY